MSPADRAATRAALLAGRDERRQERQARKAKAAASRLAKLKADPLGAWAALRRAEADPEAAQRTLEGFRMRLGLERAGLPIREVAKPTVRLDAPLGVLEDHLRIDLRVLSREADYWAMGERRTCVLTEGVLMIIDLRPEVDPHIRFVFRANGKPASQILRLQLKSIGGRKRPVFLHPLSGPVEVVALREGRFASAHAQRLVHRSKFPPKDPKLPEIERKQAPHRGD